MLYTLKLLMILTPGWKETGAVVDCNKDEDVLMIGIIGVLDRIVM